ncbi:hypothetical protein EDB85DRAFT_1943640 [Lactarius pseudohatsudake]|nr:hypothetical protein EDB85DRAFT_1943640 [Lactarius pseudohatsudake]
MPISIPTFLSYFLLIGSAYAQVSAPNCTDSTFAWSLNSLQQNPCLVTAYLAAVCNNGVFAIPALLPQHYYTGPSGADIDDLCKCNTVVYNLISACDVCQGEPWIPYSTWSLNCTTNANPGTFPNPVPAGTRVPKWAYIDSSISDNWNASAARLVGDSPEVTGTVSIVKTRVSQSTLTPSASGTGSFSNAGVIAGGVVGGIVGAALIAVVLWFAIRRKPAHSAPYLGFQGGQMVRPLSHPLTEGAPKFYDPSDPTTYPNKVYLPLTNQRLSSTGHLQLSDSSYSGLPEV